MWDDLPTLADLEGLGWSLWWALGPTLIQVWLIVRSCREERHLRRQLADADTTITELCAARDEAMTALDAEVARADELDANNDAWIDALYDIADAQSLPAAREIACNVLDIPIYPTLRRVS
jgi:hypothetical protein